MNQRMFLGVWPSAIMVAFGCGGNASEGSNRCDAVATGGAGADVVESSAGAGQGQNGGTAHGQAGAVHEDGRAGGAGGTVTGGAVGIGGGTVTGGAVGIGGGTVGIGGGTVGIGGGTVTGGAPNNGEGPVATWCVYANLYGGTASYRVGDTFYATDGCNTCVCDAGGQVSCTEMICTCDGTEENPNRVYQDSDPTACRNWVTCPALTTLFMNECGCGCQQSPDCPPYLDCMPRVDGPPPCTALTGKCPYSKRLE